MSLDLQQLFHRDQGGDAPDQMVIFVLCVLLPVFSEVLWRWLEGMQMQSLPAVSTYHRIQGDMAYRTRT